MSRPAARVRLERSRRHRKLFFGCESLEDRRLMAIVTVESPPGVLTLTGDGADDLAIIESNAPGSVDIDDGIGFGATTYTGINQVIFHGNGGNDELRIIQNNIAPQPAANIFLPINGIQFHGGSGSDTLTMAGGTPATFGAGTYTSGGPGSGEVRYDILTSATDSEVDFTGVELINDTTTAGAFTAQTGGGNDTMVIEPGPNLPPVGGVQQGPVVVDGGDRDDHGNFSGGNQNGWKYMEQMLDFVLQESFITGTTRRLLVIGANSFTALNAINSVVGPSGLALGGSVDFINSATAIAGPDNDILDVNFSKYEAIFVPSDNFNTSGGITAAQVDALETRTAAITQYVRDGGGIVALTEQGISGPASPYGWLAIPSLFITADSFQTTQRQTTHLADAFSAAGLSISNLELSNGTPTHNMFLGPAGFNGLDPWVVFPGGDNLVDAANGGEYSPNPSVPSMTVLNGVGGDQINTIGQGAINTQIGGGDTVRITGTLTTIQVGQKTNVTGDTGGGNDSLTLNGATIPLDNLAIPVTLAAGSGIDTVTITDAADMNGDTVTVNHLQVTGLSASVIPYSGAETLVVGTTQGHDNINVDFTTANGTTTATINSFDGNDTFGTIPANRVRPSLFTTLTLNGGSPIVLPGDRLNLDMSATTAPIFVDTVGGQALSQSHLPIFWSSIETYDVIDDSGPVPNVDQGDLFVRTTPANDYVVFSKGSGVSTRVRVGAGMYTFFPTNQIICYGREGDDFITASNITLPVDFRGEVGNDYLTGGVANDWLVGGLNNDRINGSHGDNVIWGDDSPVPNTTNPQDLNVGGDDVLSGLGGTDVFYGGGGNDQVSGGAGNDYAHGGFGNDVLDGNEGDDRLYGGAGIDKLSGFNGNDLLSGGGENDLLYGQSGNDVLIGGAGADLVDGGDGDDLLISGTVTNENTSRTSLANTSTFPAANYINAADNDAAMLVVLANWGATNTISGMLGPISHDGDNDDLYGSLGDDDFCWELADVLDNLPGGSPPDFLAPGMGNDVRIAPIA